MIEVPKAVTVYDETIVEGKLKPLVEITNSFGSDALKEQVGRKTDLSSVMDGV